jgi:hypothetical protein
MQRRSFGRRVNAWLAEAPGEVFKDGKWRFWFPVLIGFSILNAVLTAVVFGTGGNLQTYMGSVLVGVGALLAWLGVGALHYSDSTDPHLSRGVAALDSVTLVFMAGHFCFLLWVYGHVSTLQRAEADYKIAAEKYNADARQVQADNAKIADALRAVSENEKERAKVEQDTAYQLRQAAKHGARINTQGRREFVAASLSTSPVELEKPPEPPEESSAAFLSRWDSWVRLANFGELALAITTLIYIRVRSAKTNTTSNVQNVPAREPEEDFPDQIDITEKRSPPRRENLMTPAGKDTSVLVEKKDTAKTHASFDFGHSAKGAKRLREALRDISFRTPNRSFKIDIKSTYLWIRQMQANQGTQETIHSAKAKLSILDDALTMPSDAFRERLETFLRKRGFEI